MKLRWMLTPALLLALLLTAGRAETMTVDFYDMGKADAMLVTLPDGFTMLIDAGTNKGGKALVERFEQAGVGPVDMMVVTHYDKDHVGGADKIIEDVGVGAVVMPIYDKESKQYDQFIEAMDERPDVKRMPVQRAGVTSFERGGAVVTISAAHEADYGADEENDFSLAVRITYGDVKFFFTGDAEGPRQRELLSEGDVKCDVLKVPYHGRLTDVSAPFAQAASPKIAFITDSEEEPANPVLVRLYEETGAQVYCARDGGIRVVSDGKHVSAEEMD